MANEVEEESKNLSEDDENEEINGTEVDEEEDESQFDDPDGFVDSISDEGKRFEFTHIWVNTFLHGHVLK